MKRRIILVVSLVFFSLLIIAVSVYLEREYLTRIIEQKVVHKIEDAIGRRIKFSDSQVNLFPFYWNVNNAHIVDEDDGKALLTAKEVRVYLSLANLLNKRVHIGNIRVVESTLVIKRYPDGRMNIKGLFPDTPKTGWKVKIDKIQIVNGRIRVSDELKGRDVLLTNVSGHVFPDLVKKEVTTDLSSIGDYKDPVIAKKNLDVKGVLVFVAKNKKLERVKVRKFKISSAGGSSIYGEGYIRGDDYVELKGNMSVLLKDVLSEIQNKKDLNGKVTFKGSIKGMLPLPAVEGIIDAADVSYDGVKYGKANGRLLWEDGLFSLSGIKGKVLGGEIDGNISIKHTDGIQSYSVNVKGKAVEPYAPLSRYLPGVTASLEEKGTVNAEITANGNGRDRNEVEARGWITYNDESQKLSLSGQLNRGLNLSAGMTGELRDIASYLHIPHFPLHGPASLSGDISGTIARPVVSGVVTMPEGMVNGVTFDSITADLSLSEGNLALKPVVFRKRDAIYSMSGTIRFRSQGFKDPYFDLGGDITQGVPKDITTIFYKELPVDMKASGRIEFTGDSRDFSGNADMNISGISAYGQTFDSGHVAVTLTTERVVIDRVKVERRDEAVEGSGWIGYSGESKGTFQAELNSQQFILQNEDIFKKRLPSVSGTGTFSVKGSGKLSDPIVEAAIQVPHLMINGTDTGLTQLTMSKSGDELKISGKLMAVDYKGTVGWSRDAPFEIFANIDNSSLNTFLLLLKPSLARDITITATGEFRIKGMLFDLNTLEANALFTEVTGHYVEYLIENDGDIHISYQKGKLSLDIVRFKGEGTSLGMIGAIALHGESNVFINGEADLRLLALFTPEIKYSRGKMFIAFLMSGDLKNPAVQGGLVIKDGTIRSNTLKQTLEGAELSLFFNGREIVLESMSGRLGGGTVNVTGKVTTEDFAVKEFGFVLEIADAVFRYPEGLTSRIDGTLILKGTPESKGMKGEINLAKVSYEKNMNLRSMIFELRKKKVNNEQPLPFIGNTELNIYIAGKKDLWINNNIAKLPFEVDLILKGTVDHPLLFGRIEALDGTFIFNSNDFKVISAAIDFVSPETIKPVMDLHASTEVRGYIIDMRLSGTYDRVDLSLSSDPVLSETDILALLTTGQTASEASDTLAEVGAFEATAFLAAPIKEKLEETLSDIIKIDRFQVDPYYSNSTSSAGARLTVGKRLMGDKLYVTYTTGLTTVEELIKLEYLLSRNVYLVGERDELGRVSGDIKFRFEFK
ncbi:MAG TPA: translocation/assembly module TamB domain-containing protein [Nitrospirota bacterium]|nr:translocation/assembly module TamB domain-containing protein [Nitrospirota bacterium]